MRADGLVVEELVHASELLEEFEFKVRKLKGANAFLIHQSVVQVVYGTDLNEVLVLMVILIGCGEASNRVCKHETCLYAHPFNIIPVRLFSGLLENPIGWNSHLNLGITAREVALSASVDEICGILLANVVDLHL